MTRVTTIMVSTDLRNRIHAQAAAEGRTADSMLERLIEARLDQSRAVRGAIGFSQRTFAITE